MVATDHCTQVRSLNRLQFHSEQQQQQQQQQQQVLFQNQTAVESQTTNTAVSLNAVLDSHLKNSNSNSAIHSIIQAGALQLSTRSAYAISVSLASAQQPHVSLHVVATAANLVHELANIRRSRVEALAVIDLCRASSRADFCADEEGVLNLNSRCLQVSCVSIFNHPFVFDGFCLQAALDAKVLLKKFGNYRS